MTVAAFTSTGSKHPEALFGGLLDGVPVRMTRSAGCTVHGSDGRAYLDFVMALGAVALGYGHPEVNAAVIDAVERGGVGSLSPVDEEALASDLSDSLPWVGSVRFLKSGAEAVAAAVRLARVATGRDAVLGCGYHGWLDWCSEGAGVPMAVRALYGTLPFNDCEATRTRIRAVGDRLACVVIEPMIERAPDRAWLDVLRDETHRLGAVLIFDEVKTAFRVGLGGATERWGVQPDLIVLGKALANGYPLAAVGGTQRLMEHVRDTWISSTLATEFVSLAAARATMRVMRDQKVPAHLGRIGTRLWNGLKVIAGRDSAMPISVRGIPEMCHLEFGNGDLSRRVAAGCARRGLLWKHGAYNFVSLAHDNDAVDRALAILGDVVAEESVRGSS